MTSWKIFGIVITLCVTLAVADYQEYDSSLEQYYSNYGPIYPPSWNRILSINHPDTPKKGHHGHHKPHNAPSSEESNESHESWEHKNHRHPQFGRPIPHFPPQFKHPLKHPRGNQGLLERRRPMFYPYLPYHFYHPHAYPSNNDDEFETIEARGNRNFEKENKEQSRFKFPFFPHHPHVPLNSDSSQESNEFAKPIKPFLHHHHQHHHGHGKPPSNESIEEGSGEADIVPLADGAETTF